MKRILSAALAAACLSATMLCAQEKNVTRTLDAVDFKSIDVSSSFKVRIVEASEQSVVLTYSEELEPYVVAKVVNGKLQLYLDTKNMTKKTWLGIKNKMGANTLEARITTDRMESLEVSGVAEVSVDGKFNEDHFELDLSGASKVEGLEVSGNSLDLEVSGVSKLIMPYAHFSESNLDASGAASVALDGDLGDVDADLSGTSSVSMSGNYSRFDVDLSGTASLTVSGKANSLDVDASGAGSLKAQELVAGNVSVSGSGATNIVVCPTEKISIDISGASRLRYAKGAATEMISVSRGSSIETF